MTEEEAKKKWCPFARSRVVSWQEDANHLINAIHIADKSVGLDTRCFGSACMAWRRYSLTATGPIDQGYCGLAGGADIR